MKTIKLRNSAWQYDPRKWLGPPGGFGEVFEGRGPKGAVAVKRLKLSVASAARREMTIGEALADRQFDHVVPVFDFGQDAEGQGHFLIMPVCERSLQQYLGDHGTLSVKEAIEITAQIVQGLIEVGDLVHRDLKPDNVLFHEGRWKIADFGISKFIDDATSLDTLREAKTPLYAAPEQWRRERPSHATDVYALGCIFFALVNGEPPFAGLSYDDLCEAHSSKTPELLDIDERVAAFVGMMLRKSPESRPGLNRCLEYLTVAVQDIEKRIASPGRRALAEVGRDISAREAADEAERLRRKERAESRRRLAIEAIGELASIRGRLFEEICSQIDTFKREDESISLGLGRIDFHIREIDVHIWRPKINTEWDVVAWGNIAVRCQIPKNINRHNPFRLEYYDFASNLVFSKTSEVEEYRWRELSFASVSDGAALPVPLEPGSQDFAAAIDCSTHTYEIAYGPFCIDGEFESEFQERWINLLTKAAQGALRRPPHFPIDPGYFR